MRSPDNRTSTDVAIVVQGNYPLDRDVRTRKMAKSLDESGSNVFILGRNSLEDPDLGQVKSSHPPREEDIDYAHVRRFSWLLSTPLFRLITAKVPVNPFWILWLVVQFRAMEPEIVIPCDIRAGLPAIVAAKLCGIPTVLDLRENFAELAREKPVEHVLDHVVLNTTLVGTVERLTVQLADLIWVVAEERKENLVAAGKAESAVHVVGNVPLLREISSFTDKSGEYDNAEWPGFTFVYVGSINRFRGLDLLIDGIWHANRTSDHQPIHLAIAGDGPDKERLERRAETLGITEHVDFLGWIPPDTVTSFLRSGDVGVIPHEVSSYTNQTIPNKLFDYMSVQLPVLTTPTRPTARIVNDVNCGKVLPYHATGSVAGTVMREMQQSDGYSTWAENGRLAIESRYNWEHEMERACSILTDRFGVQI